MIIQKKNIKLNTKRILCSLKKHRKGRKNRKKIENKYDHGRF